MLECTVEKKSISNFDYSKCTFGYIQKKRIYQGATSSPCFPFENSGENVYYWKRRPVEAAL